MFVARQPIFNRKLEVYGYELLFRSDNTSTKFDGTSSLGATATVIEELFESGIDCIVEDKYAFVNFDAEFIQSDTLELIGPERLIVEILEDVKVDFKLFKKLRELRKKGYRLALDDFVDGIANNHLVNVADIIKYDLIETPLSSIQSDVNIALARGKVLLAEKIETKEEFLEAKEMGFHLFQGFFFSKPSIVSKSFNKATSRFQYLNIMKELRKSEPSYDTLAEIVSRDVNLAYRLLRVVSYRSKDKSVESIKRALTYMGLKEIERWTNVLMLRDAGKSKPLELMKISMIRSKFAESIALEIGLKAMRYEASMMGLFSVLDAMLDKPMELALQDIAIPKSVTDALINNKGMLSPIYRLLISYEQGQWSDVENILEDIKITEQRLYELYKIAIGWANDILMLIA